MYQRSWSSFGPWPLFLSPHWLHIFSRLKHVGFIPWITFHSSSSESATFCVPLQWDPNWNMCLLPGTPLHRRIRPSLRSWNKICYLGKSTFFVVARCSNYQGELSRITTEHVTAGSGNVMSYYLLMYLKTKLVSLPYPKLFLSAPLEQSETTLRLW
jgi:hypothetical protein